MELRKDRVLTAPSMATALAKASFAKRDKEMPSVRRQVYQKETNNRIFLRETDAVHI